MKRLKFPIALVLLAAVCATVWQVVKASEPVYNGKRLRAWLVDMLPPVDPSTGEPMVDPSTGQVMEDGDAEAREAVRHIGTRAVPTLLRLLRAKDSALKDKIMGLLERQHIIKVEHWPAEVMNRAASKGFKALGTNAASAVPELIEIARENISFHSKQAATESLGYVGPPAKAAAPFLFQWATNSYTNALYDPALAALVKIDIQTAAKALTSDRLCEWLSGQGSVEPETGGILLYPEAHEVMRLIGTNAIPFLLRQFRTPAGEWNAAQLGLRELGPNAAGAVPGLIQTVAEGISSPSVLVYAAIQTLGYIGPPAKQAVPYLRQWATNSDHNVHDLAIGALMSIDPEAGSGIINNQ